MHRDNNIQTSAATGKTIKADTLLKHIDEKIAAFNARREQLNAKLGDEAFYDRFICLGQILALTDLKLHITNMQGDSPITTTGGKA